MIERGTAALEALDMAEEASLGGQGSLQSNAKPSSSAFLDQQLAGLLEDSSLEDPFLLEGFDADTLPTAQNQA